jgi:hypothetical protein
MNFFSKAIDIILYKEENYIYDVVDHFISMNEHTYGDFLILEDNLQCILTLKSNPTEFFTFDKRHRIRVYIPFEVHLNKMRKLENFHDVLLLNHSEVVLKNVRIDLKIMRSSHCYYANLVLMAGDYDIINSEVYKEIPESYIDSLPLYKNYLNNTNICSFGVGDKDFLLFSMMELNYKTEIGKTNDKVATYSIKKNKYINFE